MILSLLIVSAIISMVLPPMDSPSPTSPLAPTMSVFSATVTTAPFFPTYYAFIAFIVSMIIVTVTVIVVFRRTTPTIARTDQHLSLTPHLVEGYSLSPMVYGVACLLFGAILLSSFTLMYNSVVRLCFGLISLKDDAHPLLYTITLLIATLGVFDDNLHFMGTCIALSDNVPQQSAVVNKASACNAAEPTLADETNFITPKVADALPVVLTSPLERSDAEPLPLPSITASSHLSPEAAPPAPPEIPSNALLDFITPAPISTTTLLERAANCNQVTAAQLVPDLQNAIIHDTSSHPTPSDENENTHTIVSISVGAYTIQTTAAFQDETFSTLNSLCEELRQQKQLNAELKKNLGCTSQQLKKSASTLTTLQSKCARLENHLEARHDDIQSLDDQIYRLNQEIREKDDDLCVKDDTIVKTSWFLADSKKQIALLQSHIDKSRLIITEQADAYRESQRTLEDERIENGRLKTEVTTAQEALVQERYEKLDAKVAAEERLRVEIQAFQNREDGLKALLMDKNEDLEKMSSKLEEVRADRDKVHEELRKVSKSASVPIAPSTPPRRYIPRSTRTVPATTSYSAGSSRTPASPVKPPSSARKVDSAVLAPVSNHVGYRRPPPSPVKAPTRATKAENASPSNRSLTRTETLLPRFDGTKPRK